MKSSTEYLSDANHCVGTSVAFADPFSDEQKPVSTASAYVEHIFASTSDCANLSRLCKMRKSCSLRQMISQKTYQILS